MIDSGMVWMDNPTELTAILIYTYQHFITNKSLKGQKNNALCQFTAFDLMALNHTFQCF